MVFLLPGARVNYPGQGTAYIVIPKTPRERLPVVIAIHGSGRGALDYRDTPFYIRQQQLAEEYGCLFAAVSNGPDTWGTDDGLHNVECLLDYVQSQYKTASKVLLWATSAGGVLAHRLIKRRPKRVAAVLGTFPVYDLEVELSILKSCRQAWGVASLDELRQKTAGKNPPELIGEIGDIPFFLAHGDADEAVPLAENSGRLAKELGSSVHLEVITGGSHSAGDMRYLENTPSAALRYYVETVFA